MKIRIERRRPQVGGLTDEEIDRVFDQARATIREVREQTASSFVVPAGVRGLVLR